MNGWCFLWGHFNDHPLSLRGLIQSLVDIMPTIVVARAYPVGRLGGGLAHG
jgi:hypothetical protein